ncbi:PIN domain-containing protein [Alteromonas sp. BMJM2]|uniref:PIN domain-containing protein n=1 Tax=Alteromonas sp. BMJM2 TaxID=2954241 RepID=UPI0022B44600|nr:PIN domain-containing protein [Alteromonas sp. BMJM2]
MDDHRSALVLDTQVFENLKFNFLHSYFTELKNLKSFYDFDIILPTVVDREVTKRLSERIRKVHAGLLKEKSYLSYFKVPQISLEDALEEALTAYDEFKLKFRVKVVGNQSVKVDDVLELYFNRQPPFSDAKKSEFPDAISLLALKTVQYGMLYVITADQDWVEFCKNEDKFTCYKSLPFFIDERLTESSSFLATLKQALLSGQNFIELNELVVEKFKEMTSFEIYVGRKLQDLSPKHCEQFELSNVNLTDFKKLHFLPNNGYSIDNNHYCSLQLELSFSVYVQLGIETKLVKGMKIDVPIYKRERLATTASFFADLKEGSIVTLSFMSFDTQEWFIEN